MAYEMRRKDHMLSEEETKEILAKGDYGVLSTVGEDGCPYGVPVNYVYENGAIYFHCAAGIGHKLANIAHNSRVSFTVVTSAVIVPEGLTTKYTSAIAFGTAECVSGEEKRSALIALINKYATDFMDKGMVSIEKSFNVTDIIKITVDSISGKANK